ncbi:MAG: DUF485 domain-containing protein [Kurthia gibsonii]|uniref:DUF485 domain-containing protein n=1 Tax=Kurthia gibsonii TaxID=33946 RepID=A0ABU9LIT6_9BACL|nr:MULTISPECIES: DUF485 domain-containing protein [Kurthia]AMA64059.1 hypothetical protein ASO14_1457 [Kurthia sp. 11kri321]MEB6112197.1 DUF485 domain-containing protein [Kurthia gibsonii]MEB7771115.1 DUF485 domain-containing protein [Kurthia gibsonii]RXH51834.1 DUF485 domain-containing protein [Kurthia gibsonii]WIL37243.1 DUF485 domain-containing protein [Kurthia sp. YJT4]
MDQNLNGSDVLNAKATSTEVDKAVELTEQEYVKISESSEYHALVKKKNKFLVPMTIFFLAFYFTLPLLTSFTKVLHAKAIGDITWVWIFALAQFIMVWAFAMIYVKKANAFDKDAAVIIEKAKDGGYK